MNHDIADPLPVRGRRLPNGHGIKEKYTITASSDALSRIVVPWYTDRILVGLTGGHMRSFDIKPFPSSSSGNRVNVIFKIPLLLYLAVISFPFRFSPVQPGLDGSWTFAINYFFHKSFIFGKDVIWTYGPLGFLSYPQNVGANLDIATAFQLSLWIIFLGLIARLTLKSNFPPLNLFLFVLLFSGGQAPYYLGYVGYDYCMSFLVLFCLSLSFFSERWRFFMAAAFFLVTLLLFVKFSSALVSVATLVLFLIVIWFTDAKKGLFASGLALMVPVSFVLLSQGYFHSMTSMFHYLRGAYELVSGYGVAMTWPGSRKELLLAFIAVALYFFLMTLLFKTRQASFLLSVVFIGPLFVMLKHGFIRQGTHTMFLFSFVLFLVGIIVLFTNIRKFQRGAVVTVLVLLGLSLSDYVRYSPPKSLLAGIAGYFCFTNMNAVIEYSHTKEALEEASRRDLEPDRLPPSLLRKIGSNPVGIFPWEVSYAAANNLNYAPFPVFQTYSAYTPYLDRLNSARLENPATAPGLILFEWKAIDGRHPLMDIPAMWLSLFRWYEVSAKEHGLLLLERRSSPRFSRLEPMGKKECHTGDVVDIPSGDSPVVVKIYMNLSTRGKLFKILLKIPEVRISLQTESHATADFRIVPDTLRDGLLLNSVPLRLDDVESLLSGRRTAERVRGFRIYGKGLDLYDGRMIVEFFKIPDLSIM
jgi:hypothetical protein